MLKHLRDAHEYAYAPQESPCETHHNPAKCYVHQFYKDEVLFGEGQFINKSILFRNRQLNRKQFCTLPVMKQLD